MKSSENAVVQWGTDAWQLWDQFWFTPRLPHTLAIIRILCGAMMVYLHLIWAAFVTDFMGATAWIDNATIWQIHAQDFAWSWLWYFESPTILFLHQLLAILFSAAMMLGLATRFAIPLAWLFTIMTCHRLTGALFGLDQIVVMLTMYLMIAPCGSVYSIDALLRERRGAYWWLPKNEPSVLSNVATRFIQLHLCVIYLFGGLGKMRGEMWWDGSALWYSIVNYEYQSLDLTWLGRFPFIIATLTATTLFWETFYCALVWPRITRPLVLIMAVLVHGGIAVALGMVTFGTIMVVANGAFIQPEVTRRWVEFISRYKTGVARRE